MPFRSFRSACLAGAALCALNVAAATAKDLPATPEGAQKINAFLATYLGATQAFKVTPEGADYLVSFDLAALTAPLQAAGFAYDPATFTYKLIEQDDGAWRIDSAGIPAISSHGPHGSFTLALTGDKGEFVVDPAIAWFRSATGSGDKATLHAQVDTGAEQTLEAGPWQFAVSGSAAAGGLVSSVLQKSATDVRASFVAPPKADAAAADPKTNTVTAHLDKLSLDANLDGFKSHAALDLWAFLAAHPKRPDLAANEAALKPLIAAVAASPLKLNEAFALDKVAVQTPNGAITLDLAKFGFGADATGSGAVEEHIAFNGLALPPDLVPAPFRDFAPTSLDLTVKASGFDVAAARAEAIADLHFAGDAPPLSPDDRAKVWAKLTGGGPVTIDVPLSHIVAPHLDLAVEGRVIYKNGRPTGSFTIHMRNFDSTMAALKDLGPDTERKLIPALAMAKGLARTDGDGVLTWVGELGPDGGMKVNGLPLGKAPL